MTRFFQRQTHKIGLAPGSLVYAGKKKEEAVRMSLIDYDEHNLVEKQLDSLDEVFPTRDTDTVSWIKLDGVHDVKAIERLGNHFGIHPLVLEDIINTNQRPKMEDHDGYMYIVFRMLYYDADKRQLHSEQVSLILGSIFVISFQERSGDVFDSVRERIRGSIGRIRRWKAGYLAYALLDVVIDHYFLVLEALSTQTEDLEAALIENPSLDIMRDIGDLRRELVLLRKAVWPVRDLLSDLERSESKLIRKDLRPFIRDAHDHSVQVIDIVESLRDLIGVLRDTYQSILGNRMNQIMKVLTIIATIFIPLTFMAGIYGMNFDNMPELHWEYGYPILLLAMLLVGIGLGLFFKRKNWI